ncbi:3'(2'),5'-bisphosphate nucleotidase [Ascochyta rabiei]|uniref:Phosphatidylinositol phosphorylation n=1 Tax=Didymella rabiei TaxID=5454 RepID=A0A162YLS9_DIDRA|nr:3'(2'),5'-bisphosphate nucleotidase [Ascochyta rabiei]KZM20116.1 phosphatidylinositol phosphorylation [Ascochyta rabiei]UPX17100.1 3'(2'),5'-bisphosphate nucleotidase [Ascochyta rabiei]
MAASHQPYAAELDLALRVVHNASMLTKSVLRSLKNHVSAETKADSSPVTIADFAAQALLISSLHAAYPSDSFLGEESADALRSNDALADRVWELVQRAKQLHAAPSQTGDAHNANPEVPALTFPASKEDMFDLIDLGGNGEQTRSGRVWIMDPVDGTATFMQGQQYAVCLCLLVDGKQAVGVIGCPNLAFDVHGPLGQSRVHEDLVDETGYGVVLSAIKQQGTYVRGMTEGGWGEARRVDLTELPEKELSQLNFVESTLGKTSLSQEEHKAVCEELGAQWPGTVIWAQQVKHVALALGSTDVMVRIPKTVDRFTCVWDHAGGHLLFTEAGGLIKDFNGGDIDFSHGRHIAGERNYGMIAALPSVFEKVERAVKDILARRR